MLLLRTCLVNVLLKTNGVRDGVADLVCNFLLFGYIIHQVVHVVHIPAQNMPTTAFTSSLIWNCLVP